MRILGYPKVQQISSTEWRLLEALEYHVGDENSAEVINVPEGFITDFASVPRAFWWLFPPFGRYSPGAVIHDFLYTYKVYNRKKCDDIFLEAMQVMEVNWQTRYTMYWAVRVFGSFAYGR